MRIGTCGAHRPESAWIESAVAALGHQVHPLTDGDDPPDAVLVHDPRSVAPAHLKRLRQQGTRVLQRAYDDPDDLEAHLALAADCDLTLTTGFADCVEVYERAGARAVTVLPAAPPDLDAQDDAAPVERAIDLAFVGRIDGPERRERRDLLRRARRHWRVEVLRDGARRPAAARALLRRAKLALHWDRVSLNRHGITRAAPGTRPFAAPAAGCVLLTQLAAWLPLCFDVATEVAGFADVAHGLEVAGEYLRNADLRRATAQAGMARCARSHQVADRAAELISLARGDLPLQVRVNSLAPWYQRLVLPGGATTSLLTLSNEERWRRLAPHLPDLAGARVVDFGANAGFFSLQALARGAASVTAIDASPLACRQANFVFDVLRARASVVLGGIEHLARETADVVLMLAVLHHHADVEPLLRAACRTSTRVVIEWHVRDRPYHHPVDAVQAVLARCGFSASVCSDGARPIVVAHR